MMLMTAHAISSIRCIWGAGVSAGTDGQPSSTATGDTNDDGVSRLMTDKWLPGLTVQLTVTATGNTGYLMGWFD